MARNDSTPLEDDSDPSQETQTAPPSYLNRLYNSTSNYFEEIFEVARVANAGGNAAIGTGVAGGNLGLMFLAFFSGFINSYAAGEAKDEAPKETHTAGETTDETTQKTLALEYSPITEVPASLWLVDRFTSLIYGFGCGATTAASTYLMLITISIGLSGSLALFGFGAMLGALVFIATYKNVIAYVEGRDKANKTKWSTLKGLLLALLFSLVLSALYVGISFIVMHFLGPGILGSILISSTYFLAAVMGFCTTLLNYGITQNSIISFFINTQTPTIATEVAAKTPSEEVDPAVKARIAQERFNYLVLFGIAAVGCAAYGLAIGGLTYISIMSFPAAFGATLTMTAPLMSVALFISLVTTLAMIPLLIKQCIPFVTECAKIGVGTKIQSMLQKIFIFNTHLYEDTVKNRCKFYFKAFLITVAIPAAIIGSVMTLLEASGALAEVIKLGILLLPLAMRQNENKAAQSTSYTILGLALIADLIFAVTTGFKWISGMDFALDKKGREGPKVTLCGYPASPATLFLNVGIHGGVAGQATTNSKAESSRKRSLSK